MTKQKKAVLETLCEAGGHLTAEELFALAKEKLPSISRATVYNNLHALEEEERIRRISDKDADFYDKAYDPHPHLICASCKRIEDLPMPWLSAKLEEELGMPPISYEFKILALCSECRKKNS